MLARSLVFVKLAGNQDRHKISDVFEFWPDQTSHFGVIYPWLLKKAVQGIVLSFLNRIIYNDSLYTTDLYISAYNIHVCETIVDQDQQRF